MGTKDLKIQIASDVNERDGIGIEVYKGDKLMMEIFRDDTELIKTITLYDKTISLEIMEYAIELFKKEIPNDFIDYSKLDSNG